MAKVIYKNWKPIPDGTIALRDVLSDGAVWLYIALHIRSRGRRRLAVVGNDVLMADSRLVDRKAFNAARNELWGWGLIEMEERKQSGAPRRQAKGRRPVKYAYLLREPQERLQAARVKPKKDVSLPRDEAGEIIMRPVPAVVMAAMLHIEPRLSPNRSVSVRKHNSNRHVP